jgi:hypothetical protein
MPNFFSVQLTPSADRGAEASPLRGAAPQLSPRTDQARDCSVRPGVPPVRRKVRRGWVGAGNRPEEGIDRGPACVHSRAIWRIASGLEGVAVMDVKEHLDVFWANYTDGKIPTDRPRPEGPTLLILLSKLPSPIPDCRCASNGHPMTAEQGDTVFLALLGEADRVDSAVPICPFHATVAATLDRWGEFSLVWSLEARRLTEDTLDLYVRHENELYIVREVLLSPTSGSVPSRDSAPMH